jgi:hypothetical protein
MTVTRETYKEFIGRVNYGDIEPIISAPETDFEAVDHIVKNDSDVIFTWDYTLVRPQLRKLYEKAKNNQWNGETALDWSTEVDEARHVEVFAKYAKDKLGGTLPFNWHIQSLVDDTIADNRWDMTYLGMQIMVEGLGLASMAYMRELTNEPLLKQLLRNVMADEARHISFGIISLKEIYAEMSDAEIMERQQFAYEASIKLGERMLQQEVYEKMGVKTRDIAPYLMKDPAQAWIRKMLAAKIVPNVSKLGLLDRNGAWLRRKFEEMGTIEFENLGDSEEEFSAFVHSY